MSVVIDNFSVIFIFSLKQTRLNPLSQLKIYPLCIANKIKRNEQIIFLLLTTDLSISSALISYLARRGSFISTHVYCPQDT
jgi:hypothetical protein